MGFVNGRNISRFGVAGAFWSHAVTPGLRVSEEPGTHEHDAAPVVMLAPVASIHVLNTAFDQQRRGWSGQARP